MRTRLVLMLVGGVLLATLPARAHHSFAAEFDVNQPVTLNGTLTKMEWLNPHGWIYIDVAQPDGKVVNWAIEAGAPRANGKTVKFKDGRNFFLGAGDAPGAPPAP